MRFYVMCKVQIFNKPFSFYINPKCHLQVFKILFKAFYSDQDILDFLDTCSTFVKKRLVNKSFEFIGREKDCTKKIKLMSGFRLQTPS